MNVAKIMILTCELDIINTLTTRKNIMKFRRLKKLRLFKVIFEKSKKILKSNNF